VRLIRYPVAWRVFRPRQIILVTTLLDPVAYPAAELAQFIFEALVRGNCSSGTSKPPCRWTRSVASARQCWRARSSCTSSATISSGAHGRDRCHSLIKTWRASASKPPCKPFTTSLRSLPGPAAVAKPCQLTNDLLETLARAPVPDRPAAPSPASKAPAQALPLDDPPPERLESQNTPPGSPQKSRGLITRHSTVPPATRPEIRNPKQIPNLQCLKARKLGPDGRVWVIAADRSQSD